MTDIDKKIAELKALKATATPGPWEHEQESNIRSSLFAFNPKQGRFGVATLLWPRDAALIVAMRNYLPELIAEIERRKEHGVRLLNLNLEITRERDAANARAEKAGAELEKERARHKVTIGECDGVNKALKQCGSELEQMQKEREAAVTVLMAHESCPVVRAPENSGHHFWKGNECVECCCKNDRREPCWNEWLAQEAAKRGATTELPSEVDRDCTTCKHSDKDGASDCGQCQNCCEDTFSSWEYLASVAGEE